MSVDRSVSSTTGADAAASATLTATCGDACACSGGAAAANIAAGAAAAPAASNPPSAASHVVDHATHRRLAVNLFNRTWELIDLGSGGAAADASGRTPEQTDEMIHAAHASRWHWAQVGGPKEVAIGEWQCSHVHALAGHADAARYHALRNLKICREHGIGDFVLAFAHEALARAAAVAGDAGACAVHLAHAREAGEQIAEGDDREWFFACLETVGGK